MVVGPRDVKAHLCNRALQHGTLPGGLWTITRDMCYTDTVFNHNMEVIESLVGIWGEVSVTANQDLAPGARVLRVACIDTGGLCNLTLENSGLPREVSIVNVGSGELEIDNVPGRQYVGQTAFLEINETITLLYTGAWWVEMTRDTGN